MNYLEPCKISPSHLIENFDCGTSVLNDWLKQKSLKAEKGRTARTYVVVASDGNVAGYYCISAGSVQRRIVPKGVSRNTPNPIPVIVLGRLAIDICHQGKGLGQALVRHAIKQSYVAADAVGARALLVHALNEAAKAFYLEKCRFSSSPVDPLVLLLPFDKVQLSLNPLQETIAS